MPETTSTPYSQLLMRILEQTYAQHPWQSDGETIPVDIALDVSGGLPVWWNQIAKTAALLDISEEYLPAERVADAQSLSGWKLVWKDDIALSATGDYLLRVILPALAMDAIHVLHQQEDILAQAPHLGMFPDSNALTKNLTEGLSVSQLITPCEEEPAPLQGEVPSQESTLPNEAAAQRSASPIPPLPTETPSIH